jgi:hypothetical protein
MQNDDLAKAAHALGYRRAPSKSLVISLEKARQKRMETKSVLRRCLPGRVLATLDQAAGITEVP